MSPKPEHLRRPKPKRTAPIRSVSELLDEHRDPPPEDRTPPDTQAEASAAEASGDTSIRGAVDLGYRVIDDYLKQGRRFAEDVAGKALGGDGPGTSSDIRAIADRLSRDWLLLVTRVVDSLGGIGANVGEGGHSRERPGTASPSGVTVWLDAPGPASVTLDLSDDSPGQSLRVQPLRSMAEDSPAIGEVSVAPAEGRVGYGVSVRVSPDQPPGLYSGVVFDEATERPCGTLCVQLDEQAGGDE